MTVGILSSHFKSGIEFHSHLNLELQSCFAGSVGQCLHASVIDVTASIENHFCDALSFGTLGNRFANVFCHSHVTAAGSLSLFSLCRVGRDHSLSLEIVDELNLNGV